MPAVFENGGWIAHADHIDQFFKNLTFKSAADDIDQVDDDDD